jgi:hypothetical protein
MTITLTIVGIISFCYAWWMMIDSLDKDETKNKY